MLNTNEVRIETCTKCNYSCIFCPHSTKFEREKILMDYNTFEVIVNKIKDELPNITDITISGFGEAFLDFNIISKIKLCRTLGYKVHILTNGSLLNKHYINMINEYQVDDIRISLHAVEEKPYRKITKSKDLKIVLDNIDNIINKTNLNLILTFDIVKGINEDQVEKAKDKYSNSVIIEAWKPHNWVNAFTYRKGDSVKSTCGRPWKSPYQIQVDGTVNMCCFDYNGKLLLGNFLNQTMKEIFNGQEYLNLKKHHENGTLDTSSYICKNCDQRKDQSDIIIYNNKFKSKDRLNRTSTTYKKI